MRTAEFLAHLKSLQVRVWTEDGELRCSAPKGVLTAELRAQLGERKQEILTVLESARRVAPDAAAVNGAAIGRAPRDRELPLSFTQQRLWFLQRLDPSLTAYNIPMSWTLRGPLDADALERALLEVVRRHEVLRTVFPTVEGRPVPEVRAPEAVRLERLDAGGAEAVRAELQERARQPFDLAEGPLIRPALARIAADEHVLFVCVHHIVFDGWSIEGFLTELTSLYAAFAEGAPSPLDELPIQYVDFAFWQRGRLTGDALEAELDYWRGALGENPPLLELPLDRARPPVQTYAGAKVSAPVPKELIDGLGELAAAQGASLFMALLTAYKTLLARYTGQDDVVVASPIAGRDQPEVAGLLGFFANTLVLRTSLDGAPSFRELLARVRDVCLGAYEHQEVPFERLVDELAHDRNLAYSPLFQTLFLIEEAVGTDARMGEVAVEPFELETFVARTDVMFYLYRAQDDWSVWAEYNTDLFDAATVERLLGHYVRLLEAVVSDPDAPVGALEIQGADEARRQLVEWNDTAAPFPDVAVHAQFEARVDATPEAVALLWPDPAGDVSLTYRELDERANRMAHWLIGRGVAPDTLVGLNLERSPDMLIAALAIQKAGAAYVPLDPAFPADRIEYMIQDAGLEVVVRELSDEDRAAIDACPGDRTGIEVPVSARMYVIYTSGSTGRPKGVELEHRSVSNFLATMSKEPGLAAGDSWLAVTTLSFDISVYELFCPLVNGGTVILASKEQAGDGATLRGLLERLKPSVMQATPATWRLLRLAGWEGDPGLRIFCGGEALPRDLANELVPLGAEVWNLYGPTEATIWSTIWKVEAGDGPVLIGRPIGNTQIYVLDAADRPVPIGVPGELWIGGDGLARGYLDRPELTEERFRPNPFVPGGRMYRTGDLARWRADGRLECLGRIDNQVKLRGFRIELGEIEAVIAEDGAVNQCVAVVREDTPGDQRLFAYYVREGSADVAVDALRERAREKLPAYMVPSTFVELDELPLTPNGKVDRRALLARKPQVEISDAEYVAPRNEMERRVADIWRDALRVERVAVDTNFFDLGGHSLLLAEVHARMQKELESDVSIVELFQYPTVAAVASRLDRGGVKVAERAGARRKNLAQGRRALMNRRRSRE